MRTLIAVIAAVLIAVAIGVWSNLPSRSTTDATVSKATLVSSVSPVLKAALAPGISVWEMHNQAHLENLAVQEVDDQTLVFTTEHVANK